MSTELDTQIRSVFDEIVARTPELGDVPDAQLAPVTAIGHRSSRSVWLMSVAAALTLFVIGGVFVARSQINGSNRAPVATRPSMPTESIAVPRPTATTAAVTTTTMARTTTTTPATLAAVVTTVPPTTAPDTTPAPTTTEVPATTSAPAPTPAPTAAPQPTAAPAPIETPTSTTLPFIDMVLAPPMSEEQMRSLIDPAGEAQQFAVLAMGDVDGDGDEDAVAATVWCGASCSQSVDLILNDYATQEVYVPAGYSQSDFRTFLPWFITGGANQATALGATIDVNMISLTGFGFCGELPHSDTEEPGTCNRNIERIATYSYVDGVVAPASIVPPLG